MSARLIVEFINNWYSILLFTINNPSKLLETLLQSNEEAMVFVATCFGLVIIPIISTVLLYKLFKGSTSVSSNNISANSGLTNVVNVGIKKNEPKKQITEIFSIKVPCQSDSGGTTEKNIFIGLPEPAHHPLKFQADSLKGKGATIPDTIMQTVEEIHTMSKQTPGSNFQEMCKYVLESAKQKAISADNELTIDSTQEVESLEQEDYKVSIPIDKYS